MFYPNSSSFCVSKLFTWLIVGWHCFCNSSTRSLIVSCILIFSRMWNCSSLYVRVLEARSRSKCCHDSFNFATNVLDFAAHDVNDGTSLTTSSHSRCSWRSWTQRRWICCDQYYKTFLPLSTVLLMRLPMLMDRQSKASYSIEVCIQYDQIGRLIGLWAIF